MPRTDTTRTDQAGRGLVYGFYAVGALVAAFLLFATVYTFATNESQPDRYDASLPNPMGGPAREAPGDATGSVEVAGLTVEGATVAMGDVPLGVTVVPAWDVTNPTDAPVTVRAGQPQVLEGCCPGPVYADGELTQTGQELTVPAGGSVSLQFPLQMHPGMDGPHHLRLPIAVGDDTAGLDVTGNFTATAT
jgi:hypothetical protein